MYYRFQCQSCGYQFEAQQSANDHEKHNDPHCPKCGSAQMKHLMSHVNVKTARKS
jgi:putative FmdB family regulatory protein